jgi:hypothetical protein
VDVKLFKLWEELVSLVTTIEFFGEEDALVWQFQSSGVYLSQSLYSVINFREVIPVYIHAVWKLIVPPRIHFFLWLLSKNKLLTRDNLEKRKNLDDASCLFCSDKETIDHMFFDCIVAKRAWTVISRIIGMQVGESYESIAKLWLCNKIFGITNMVTSTVCWSIWKLRNAICFQDTPWVSMQMLWHRVLPMLRCWKILVPIQLMDDFDSVVASLERMMMEPELIELKPSRRTSGPWPDGSLIPSIPSHT